MGAIRRIVGSQSAFRREAAITVAFNFGYLVISAVQGPLLARSLGPAERGDLAAVYVPFITFGWLVSLGMPGAATFYVRSLTDRQIMATAMRVMYFFAVPVALLLGIFAPAYLGDRPEATVTGLRVLLLVTTILVPVDVAEAMLRVERGAGFRYNGLRSIRPLLSMLVLVVLALAGHLTLGSAMAAFAVGTLLGATIELLVMKPPFVFRVERSVARRQLSYGSRAMGEASAHTVVGRLDQLLLAAAGFRAELGLYAVACTLSQLSAPLSQGVGMALWPAIRRADGESSARRLVVRAAVAVGIGSLTLAFALLVLAQPILRVAFGVEFEDAARFVYLLLPGEVAYDIANVLAVEMGARGRPGISTQAMMIAAGFTAVFVPFAIDRWGAEGAAVVTSIAYVLRLLYVLARWRTPPGSETAYPDPVDPPAESLVAS